MIVVSERITLIFRNHICNSVASNSMMMDLKTSTISTSLLWEGTVVATWVDHKTTIRTTVPVETTDTTLMTVIWKEVGWTAVDTCGTINTIRLGVKIR